MHSGPGRALPSPLFHSPPRPQPSPASRCPDRAGRAPRGRRGGNVRGPASRLALRQRRHLVPAAPAGRVPLGARAWPAPPASSCASPLLTPALPACRWLPPWPNRRFFPDWEGGVEGREAWAGRDLLSDGRAGQSPPDGRVAARGAAPGLCWLVRAGEGGPRGPPVRGVRPGGPASRGKAVGLGPGSR